MTKKSIYQDNKAFKQHREAQANRLNELTKQLEAGISAVFSSEEYKKYLTVMQRFHHYSFNNSLLIHMQKPTASYVAGFQTWKTLGRNVKRGEKAITILAPVPYKVEKAVMQTDENGNIKYDENGKALTEIKAFKLAAFKPTAVFDITQTEGDPLPQLAKELEGEIPDYRIFMDSIREISPVPIRFEIWAGSKKGAYNFVDKEITIKAGMSELQTAKTAIHELAHSILHSDKEHLKDPATMEVEAESIAFIIAQHCGYDVSDYSFGYLAGWSSDRTLPELKASLKVIQETADDLISKLDNVIHKNISLSGILNQFDQEKLKIPTIDDVAYRRR